MRAGFDAHLVKPVDLEQLLTVIRAMGRRLRTDTARGTGTPIPHAPMPEPTIVDGARTTT